MARARLPVRKIREVLRLKYELGLSDRKIAVAVGSVRSIVQECVQRCRQAGINWPLPAGLDEMVLHHRLYRREVRITTIPHPINWLVVGGFLSPQHHCAGLQREKH